MRGRYQVGASKRDLHRPRATALVFTEYGPDAGTRKIMPQLQAKINTILYTSPYKRRSKVPVSPLITPRILP